jgi:hypothetical protein
MEFGTFKNFRKLDETKTQKSNKERLEDRRYEKEKDQRALFTDM